MDTLHIIIFVFIGFIGNLACAFAGTYLYLNKWIRRISIIPPFGMIIACCVLLYAIGLAIWWIIQDVWD